MTLAPLLLALAQVAAPAAEPEVLHGPPVAPPGAVVVWRADPACSPSVASVTLPDPVRATCLMREARMAIMAIVERDREAPGRQSPCWEYRDPAVYDNCLDVAARRLPAISYGHSPRYVEGSLFGNPWHGCAAGISGNPIFVSLADASRVEALHGWEAANEWLWKTFDRLDLTDGPLVSEATLAARAACKENR